MNLLISNARLPGGRSEQRDGQVAIRVRDGRIVEIGRELPAGGERRLDAGGGTVLPGLVDPHVHLQSVPGATFRGDDEGSRRRAWKHQLKAYVVPADQIATAEDPRAWRDMWRRMFRNVLPRWLPSGAAGFASRCLPAALAESTMRRGLRRGGKGIVALEKAGIPVVMGSDAGAWPLVPSCFHGYSTIREMELLAAAGLENRTIIDASTRRPARMLGLQDEIGAVEVGRRADLVILAGDPLADISAFRSIRWTIKDGDARTPSEWLAA